MANFQKHVEVAAISSGLASTTLLAANLISPVESVFLWLAGSFAGILPDIDSDNSTALKIIFSLVTLFAVVCALSASGINGSLLEIWGLIIVSFMVVNFVVRPMFEKFTVHRGVFHSQLAACFFAVLAVVLTDLCTSFSIVMCWLTGAFVLLGYLSHLLLDEIYSVDFMNVEVKRSFGTALKPIEFKYPYASASMALLTVGLGFLTPDLEPFSRQVLSSEGIAQIKNAIFPFIESNVSAGASPR